MTERKAAEPISTDTLNLYRITHPDKEIRPLISRLHKLSTASSSSKVDDGDITMDSDSVGVEEIGGEMELVKLDLLKWQRSIERIMGSAFNLQTQKLFYEEKAKQTIARTEELRIALQNEKLVLERKLRDREGMLRCDVIARKITLKGKSRADLDEQITELEQSLAHHQSTNEAYITVSQSRSDKFKEILQMVEEARNMKLPDTNVSSTEIEPDSMDVDPKEDTTTNADTDRDRDVAAGGGRLNVTALPFQPQSSSSSASRPPQANGSVSSPVSRAGTPGPSAPTSATHNSPSTSAVAASSSVSTSTGGSTGRHALPSRPSRPTVNAPLTNRTNVGNASLPSRPSNLRSVTTPRSNSGGNLEEGEVGGEEEGEVNERSASKRVGDSTSRSTGTRQ